MVEFDIMAEFERLCQSFALCCKAADSLRSPNPADDRFIKMAIVGFSYHDKTENWRVEHLQVAEQYLDESGRCSHSLATKRFSMLALGALLGLYSSGKIDDRLYRLGFILLPGFVASKGDNFRPPEEEATTRRGEGAH